VKGGFALELKQLVSRVLIEYRGTRCRAL